jgi:O-Antigen ligase
MFKDSAIVRALIFGAVGLPLALFLGYQLATPDQISSLAWIGAIFCFFLVPFMIRWHHPLTIFCWNLPLVIFFLPGKQTVGVLVAGASLLLSVLGWTLQKRRTPPFIPSPGTTWPMIFLAVAVLVTMIATGGLHSRAFGSQEWGATRYLSVFGAIIGYFALIAQPTPPNQVKLMSAMYFLPGGLWLFSILFYLAGLYFLLPLFPTYVFQESSIFTTGEQVERFVGLYFMSQFICGFMLMRYGIRGLFDWHRPWRLLIFLTIFAIGMFGGFRSYLLLAVFLFIIQFYFEKLHRTSLLWIILVGCLLAGIFTASFSEELPLSFQRALSFIPGIKVAPAARYDAQSTLQWRLDMWRVVMPLVPQYLFLGKGYGFDSSDFNLAEIAAEREIAHGYYDPADNASMVSGDYHQGILTLIIPLGVWGVLAFGVFCWGGIRVLYANYRYGDPELKQINTFFLSYFIALIIFYLTVYGSFYQDLMFFVGTVGLSLSFNGGVRQKSAVAVKPELAKKAFPTRVKLAGQSV